MNLSILNPNQNVFLQHYAEIAKKCEPIKDKLSSVGFKSNFLANAVKKEFKDKKDAVSVYFVLDHNSPYLVLSNRLLKAKEDRSYHIEIVDKDSLVNAVKEKIQDKNFSFVNFEFLCKQLDKLDKNAKKIGITFADEVKYFCLLSEIDIMWEFLTYVTVIDRPESIYTDSKELRDNRPEFIYTASQELRDKYEQDVHNALYGLSEYPTAFMKDYFAERGFDINHLEALQVGVPPVENTKDTTIHLSLELTGKVKSSIIDLVKETILPKLGLDINTNINCKGTAVDICRCKLNAQAILNYKLIISLELRKVLNEGLITKGSVTLPDLSIEGGNCGYLANLDNYYQIDVYSNEQCNLTPQDENSTVKKATDIANSKSNDSSGIDGCSWC